MHQMFLILRMLTTSTPTANNFESLVIFVCLATIFIVGTIFYFVLQFSQEKKHYEQWLEELNNEKL